MKGLFLTFEGPDGAGKTTQIRRLAERLEQMDYPVTATREPGGTPIGNSIRSILLSPENHSMADRTEFLLYSASRAQHMEETILPALGRGRIVLCDRFADASVAYQSFGLGLSREAVEQINCFACQEVAPHRTYLLDLPPEESRRRLLQRAEASGGEALDRIEQKPLSYHARVREGFLQLARENPGRIMAIDASGSTDEIAEAILQDCKRLLEEHYE